MDFKKEAEKNAFFLFFEDAEDNLDIVRRAVEETDVCLSPQRNPFTSLRPVR